jgi:hypothetical protein
MTKQYVFICYLHDGFDPMGNFRKSTELQLLGSKPEEIEKEARHLLPDRPDFHIKTIIDPETTEKLK